LRNRCFNNPSFFVGDSVKLVIQLVGLAVGGSDFALSLGEFRRRELARMPFVVPLQDPIYERNYSVAARRLSG
jgi:hypothetical protein